MPIHWARQLNLHHLYHFWEVAREGHLTRAAERLHVAPSALSVQIQQLEDQLGVALFSRQGRRLLLTESGHFVLRYADAMFSLGQEMMSQLRDLPGQERVVRIGAMATLSRNMQQNFLRPLLHHQGFHVVLESGGLEDLLQRIRAYHLDVALTNRWVSSDDAQLVCKPIMTQPVVLVGPADLNPESTNLGDLLQSYPLILPGSESDIRQHFDRYCSEKGYRVQIRFEVDDMAMMRLLARDSGLLALVPEVVVQDELRLGVLRSWASIEGVEEHFYAVHLVRRFAPSVLDVLLGVADSILP